MLAFPGDLPSHIYACPTKLQENYKKTKQKPKQNKQTNNKHATKQTCGEEMPPFSNIGRRRKSTRWRGKKRKDEFARDGGRENQMK